MLYENYCDPSIISCNYYSDRNSQNGIIIDSNEYYSNHNKLY